AGWLIDNTGLKGFSIGGARVYEKQCLVIVNSGNAKSQDVIDLYTTIISRVKEKFSIELYPEANII
ncbi:MAG: UDP-N-acetylmuramate dehydrogenase, partial [Muribaculaceae bacterium]